MRVDGPKPRKQRPNQKPLLRHEIETAIHHTNSIRSAAAYMGVSQPTFARYAKIYGLYEKHKNKRGIGTAKGFAKTKQGIPLKDIFANKKPDYGLHRLKNRLIRGKVFEEKCFQCGFSEKRITDGKVPLILTFKDKFRDFTKENLLILCYNCMFLTTGTPVVAHQNHLESSLKNAAEGKIDPTSFPKDDEKVIHHNEREDVEIANMNLEEMGIDIGELKKELQSELDADQI